MCENINELLNNQWVVGIGTGLIVSLITALIMLALKKIRKKKTLNDAYEKCITILLGYIDKKGIPDEIVVVAVINVVADQHMIDPQILNTKKILEELLVYLISLKKYSDRKSKELLANLETEINKLDIQKIDVYKILDENEELNNLANDILILDQNKSRSSLANDIVLIAVHVIITIPSLYIFDYSYIAMIAYVSVITITSLVICYTGHKK